MKQHALIFLTALSFIACGGGGSSAGSTPSEITQPSNLKLVLSNTGITVEEEFNGYKVKITSSIILDEIKETSQSTIAVYGTINGSSTASLLKINTNYIDSKINVLVFKNDVLVAQSETFSVSNDDAINFGEITVN